MTSQKKRPSANTRDMEVSRAAIRREIRRRRQRRKKIFASVLLAVLIIIFGAGAGFLVFTMKGITFSKPLLAYDSSTEFDNVLASREKQRAKGFASDLCIADGNEILDDVSLESGQSGILFDLSSKKVLYANGAYNRIYPASMTKIMTAMLALKNGNMDETVTISQDNVTLEEGSQVCGFRAGDRVTIKQLVYCLLVYSGNDAASAIAEYVGGTTADFVQMMNSYAAKLGCTGTHFTNPHGLQDENHYTTPYDLYLMLNEAMKYPQFTEITQLPSYTVTYTNADGYEVSTTLEATDHYLTGEATPPKDVTILGGKTGTTTAAGNCLAILTQNAYGKPFISVITGAGTKDLLYQEMNSLLQHING